MAIKTYRSRGGGGHFRSVSEHQWCRGVRSVLEVASGLGAQPHWAPVQGPSSPTGSPGEVTYLAKAKQVTEISSVGYYIDLELYFVTVFTFLSTPLHHIFLHMQYSEMLYGLFSLADQLMHIITLSILHIMTHS